MKILTIVENLGLGGTERVAQNFSIGYKKANCDTKVLATKSLGVRAGILANENIEVFNGSENLAKSIEAINHWRPDIIHIHRPGYTNEMNDVLAAIKSGHTKVIETNVFARPDYANNAHLVDLHLLLSNWCLWKWQQWTRGLNQMGAILPYLVDCDESEKIKSDTKHPIVAHLPAAAIVLGRIGQPIPAKWDGIIFDVLEDLLKTSNNYYLVLVGLPETLKQKLKTYKNNVQQHTILIDTINNDKELNLLYQSFDIFLHAAQIGESFGMVLAEAHLNRLPIVTLNTPLKDNSQNEIVGNNRGGFVVSDRKHMVKAVERLAKDKSLRTKFGNAGHEHIVTNFELNLITQKSLKVCEILLQNLSKEKTMNALHQIGIVTRYEEYTMKSLNQNIMGSVSLKDQLLSKILHHPICYKSYLKYK